EKVFDRVMVDTGATYSVLPVEVADEIGVVEVPWREELELADGSTREVRVGMVAVEMEGRRGTVMVAVLEGSPPLIGVQALERLGFRVDPVEGRLEPTRPTGRLLAY
ncbi:MAG TPA: hypothetical protein EYP65_04950, partial [Armatimonadetes bacterium]|nr:hypothetical protein [Armatimonadota bacterium]